jgi:hypothetical protein
LGLKNAEFDADFESFEKTHAKKLSTKRRQKNGVSDFLTFLGELFCIFFQRIELRIEFLAFYGIYFKFCGNYFFAFCQL